MSSEETPKKSNKARIVLIALALIVGAVAVWNYQANVKPMLAKEAEQARIQEYVDNRELSPEEIKAVRTLLDRAQESARTNIQQDPPKNVSEQVQREISYMEQFAEFLKEAQKTNDFITPRQKIATLCATWGQTIRYGSNFDQKKLIAEKVTQKEKASEAHWELKKVQEGLEWGGDKALLAMIGRWALDEATGKKAADQESLKSLNNRLKGNFSAPESKPQ